MGTRKQKPSPPQSVKEPSSTAPFKPFSHLKSLLEEKNISLPPDDSPDKDPPLLSIEPEEAEDDQSLFWRAMADVVPLDRRGRIPRRSKRRPGNGVSEVSDGDTVKRLRNLVEHGKGFVVADTPEYIEGVRYCDNPEIARRLHRGDFSIQSHIDLHGLITADAREALEGFLRDAVASGKRAVLVVHGRGLSSPGKPVLKTKVQEWLTHGPWRKWVIAFTSARSCDGGAGATYVLLRRSPYTKRYRKQRGTP